MTNELKSADIGELADRVRMTPRPDIAFREEVALTLTALEVRCAESEKLHAATLDIETCDRCMGSGYGGHPDSGVRCSNCNGKGGILSALASAPERVEAEPVAIQYRYEPDLRWRTVEFIDQVPRKALFPKLETRPLYAFPPAPVVTDEMVSAAIESFLPPRENWFTPETVRRALEAALANRETT